MKFTIQTSDPLRLEVYPVTRLSDGSYADAKDANDPTLNGPSIVIDNDFAPAIDATPGQYFVVKVS